MTEHSSSPAGLDLTQGVPLADVPEGGIVTGHVRGKPALLVRQAGDLFAIGAPCTYYGAPLSDGLLVGDTIRAAGRLSGSRHHEESSRWLRDSRLAIM